MFWTRPTFLCLLEYADFGEFLFINDLNLNSFGNIGVTGPGYENASSIELQSIKDHTTIENYGSAGSLGCYV
jgi:hypothetical protein